MELAVFQCNGPCRCAGCSHGPVPVPRSRCLCRIAVQQEAVVQAKLALGCTGEISAHDNLAVDVGTQDGTRGGHKEVDVFNHVDEGFVLAVLDVGTTPGERPSGLLRDTGGVGGIVRDRRLDAFRRDVHLEGVCFGVLGVSEVEDFCNHQHHHTIGSS